MAKYFINVNALEQCNAKADYNANMYDLENDKALREILQKIINPKLFTLTMPIMEKAAYLLFF